MTSKPKSQSERDGDDWVQPGGSPHNNETEVAKQHAEVQEQRRGPFDIRCPQCNGPMEVTEWATRCLRETCRTVLDDKYSGRSSGKPETTVYHCAGCNAETTRRVYMGEPYTFMAICEDCDRAVQQLKGAA